MCLWCHIGDELVDTELGDKTNEKQFGQSPISSLKDEKEDWFSMYGCRWADYSVCRHLKNWWVFRVDDTASTRVTKIMLGSIIITTFWHLVRHETLLITFYRRTSWHGRLWKMGQRALWFLFIWRKSLFLSVSACVNTTAIVWEAGLVAKGWALVGDTRATITDKRSVHPEFSPSSPPRTFSSPCVSHRVSEALVRTSLHTFDFCLSLAC